MNLRTVFVSSILLFSLAAAACSSDTTTSAGDAGASAPGSCNAGKVACSGANQPYCCADYAGTFTASTVQNDCNISGGAYSANVCGSANRIGSCTLYKGTAAEKTIRYYTGVSFDPSTGCANLHGVWTAN